MRNEKGQFIKGHQPTIDIKEKISKANKGRSAWNKGKKQSEETKKKISISKKGKPRKPFTDEHKERLSNTRKGIIFTEEHKKNISKSKSGIPSKNKGKQNLKLSGKNHWNWQGGISTGENRNKAKSFYEKRRRARKFENGGSHTIGEWETLKVQYNYTCPCCGKSEPEIILTEDHIIPLSIGGSDNIENIQPLCQSCNSKKSTKIINYNSFQNKSN